jgi:hypothetical protein
LGAAALVSRALIATRPLAANGTRRPLSPVSGLLPAKEIRMQISDPHITPIVALIAGILILIMPRILNFVVAIYLIVIGLVGLNGIHHFIK